ncbi:MAG: phage holin [Eggerthellaceae bacterium]|nr:phage holin [Eggerthellaceae bacterium]
MNINWKARFKNKWFWLTIIPALLLLVQQVAGLFGVTVDIADLQSQSIAIVGTVFAILAALGVTVDMTTHGIGDSERAMGYEEPFGADSNED